MFVLATQYVFPAIVFTIMFALGLALERRDFAALMSQPRAVMLGCTLQMVLAPAIAIAIAAIFRLGAVVSVGLILLAASPGGVTSNALSLAARADLALSVTLTAISSLLVAVTLPLWTAYAVSAYDIPLPVGVSLADNATTLALLTVLPVILGMLGRYLSPARARQIVELFRWLSIALILFMCATTTIANARFLLDLHATAIALGVCLLLIASVMTIAWVSSRWARLEARQRLTIVIEVGVQNIAVALLVSMTMLESAELARLPLVYGILMLILPWIFVFRSRRAPDRQQNFEVLPQ
jgi:BASS family bile acid:Na+ symporter